MLEYHVFFFKWEKCDNFMREKKNNGGGVAVFPVDVNLLRHANVCVF